VSFSHFVLFVSCSCLSESVGFFCADTRILAALETCICATTDIILLPRRLVKRDCTGPAHSRIVPDTEACGFADFSSALLQYQGYGCSHDWINYCRRRMTARCLCNRSRARPLDWCVIPTHAYVGHMAYGLEPEDRIRKVVFV
jgi:hypothetical protein